MLRKQGREHWKRTSHKDHLIRSARLDQSQDESVAHITYYLVVPPPST
jgi:hypothetical protein